MALELIDLVIVGLYAVLLFGLANWVSREKAGHEKNAEDYFLAGKALPWWAVGTSLIAANISAEQIIGQSGQGYVVGLAIAAYEWQAAIVLLVVAKFFLPIFLEKKIYTMPQFLSLRFGGEIKTVMAVFWIFLYTAVNLTAVLWLGAVAIKALTGVVEIYAMIGLAAFAILYSIYGGLKAVALTDVVQVVILIAGGIVITVISLSLVGDGAGALAGFSTLMGQIPGHFEMILEPENPSYSSLPGIWTLLGGLWVLHFSYWGFNQYIIQRALGSKSLNEAQKGLAFAAGLKLLIPVIVVVPGIAALYLAQNGMLDQEALNASPDSTYGFLMGLVPGGLRGLVFAALIAAIVSSLASMMNSISTIFTMDVYRSMRPTQTEHHYVTVGRIASLSAMVIALVLAQPLLGELESAFQYIQEYTGFVAPGVVAVFLLGLFWQRANTFGAFAVLAVSILLSFALWLVGALTADGAQAMMFGVDWATLPFVIRIWIVFLTCMVTGVAVSLLTPKPPQERVVVLGQMNFATQPVFNISAVAIVLALIAIYVVYW